jgi:hypothetical protein
MAVDRELELEANREAIGGKRNKKIEAAARVRVWRNETLLIDFDNDWILMGTLMVCQKSRKESQKEVNLDLIWNKDLNFGPIQRGFNETKRC